MVYGLALIALAAILLFLSKKTKHRNVVLIIALILALAGIFLPLFNLI